eukprot:3196049-Amphidinium_carterae.1
MDLDDTGNIAGLINDDDEAIIPPSQQLRRRYRGKQPRAAWDNLPPLPKRRWRYRTKQPRAAWDAFESPAASATTRRIRKRPAAASRLRPAAAKTRTTKPVECCAGRGPSRPCTFSTTHIQGKARLQTDKGEIKCVFCDDERLTAMAHDKRGTLTRRLRSFAAKNMDAYEPAFAIIERVLGEDHAAKLRKVLS